MSPDRFCCHPRNSYEERQDQQAFMPVLPQPDCGNGAVAGRTGIDDTKRAATFFQF